jgi:hypothetical protein
MPEYNIELASPDETTIRVLVKMTGLKWKMKKKIKIIQRAVIKSNQPSQGGAGTPTVGLFDNLKIAESFVLEGYIDDRADADGNPTTREAKRNNIRTLLRNGQTFKIKWAELDGANQEFNVNVNGEIEFDQKGRDIHRFKVKIPLVAGTNWGEG